MATVRGPSSAWPPARQRLFSGTILAPVGIALGPNDATYITDGATNKVYGPGNTVLPINNLAAVAGIARDGDGILYVVDQQNGVVYTYDPATGVQDSLTTSALSDPGGVAVDGTGAVYISDSGNGRIVKISNQGVESTVASGYTSPQGVTVDAAGSVYFADLGGNGEIVKVPPGGQPVVLASNLGQVLGVAVDAGGSVYYTGGSAGIQILLPGGQTLTSASGLSGSLYGIALGGTGNIFTSQPTTGQYVQIVRGTGSNTLSAQVGDTVPVSSSVLNTGNAPLTLSGVALATGATFRLDSASTCVVNAVLAAGAACNALVDFQPTAAQATSDALSFASDSLNVAGTQNRVNFAGQGTLGSGTGASLTTLTVSPATATAGQAVALTATVTVSGNIPPSGRVNFLDGSTILASTTLGYQTSGNTASAAVTTTSLAVGTHNITAMYDGDFNFATSTSTAKTVTVTAVPAAISSLNFGSVAVGQSSTMTITYTQGTNPTIASVNHLDFTVSSVTCTTSCVATVTFVPQLPGLREDAVTVRDGSGNLLAKTYVYGTGTAPQFGFLPGASSIDMSLPSPVALTFMQNGVGFATDSSTKKVYQLTQGDPALPITGLGAPTGIAVDGSNILYIADQTNNRIVTYDFARQVQGVLATSALSAPLGVATDGTGAVYIADSGNNRLIRIDNQGAETVLASGLNTPRSVAVDAAGNVFYSDNGNFGEIVKLSPTGASAVVASPLGAGAVFALDASGSVYAVAPNFSGIRDYISSSSAIAFTGATTGPLTGIAINQNGDLWTTQTGTGKLEQLSRASTGFSSSSTAGQSVSHTVQLVNTGNAPLTISSRAFAMGGAFSVAASSSCSNGVMLAPGQECDTVVQFLPAAAQTYVDTLTYSSNTLNVAGAQNVDRETGVGTAPAMSMTTLAVSASTVMAGQPVILTATVTSATATPTGSVNFLDGTTLVGTAPLSGSSTGSATAQFSSMLAVGSHTLTAMYVGNGTLPASVSGAQTVTVTQATSSTLLMASPTSLPTAQPETLTATIVTGTTPVATGTVTFFDGTTQVGAVTLTATATGGTATLQLPSLAVGAHAFTARYSGDANFVASASGVQNVTVTQITTTSSLAVALATLTVGQLETLTATVAGGTGTPAAGGTVAFVDGTTTLGSAALTATSTGGTAQLTVATLSVGPHSIRAVYSGDTNYATSTSAAQSVAVTQATAATTLMLSAPSLAVSQPETLTATVQGLTSPSVSGTVTFFDGTTILGTGTLAVTGSAGTASFTVSSLAVGTHSITARYNGDANYLASSSAAQSVVVSATAQSITFPAIPNHTLGDAPFALNATASSGLAVSYAVVSGPATVSGSTVTLSGAGTVVVQATQSGNATYATASPVSQSFTVLAQALTLTGLTPAGAVVGAAATTITLMGTNFTTAAVAQVNGSAIATTYVNATTLTAVVPASAQATAASLAITVLDTATQRSSGAQTFTVSATPTVTFTGPSTTQPAQQPTVSLTLVNPYPTPLTTTLTLTFAPASSSLTDDPNVQFSTGGRTQTFIIPANTTVTPAILLQSGTVAGRITVTLVLTSNNVNVTPASVTPVVITIPATVPAISTTGVTRSGNLLTVSVHAFSNTREVKTAIFHFVAADGSTVETPDITADVSAAFTAWFNSAVSQQYGSSFTYSQDFNLSNDASTIKSVTVMLVNTIGQSTVGTAQ